VKSPRMSGGYGGIGAWKPGMVRPRAACRPTSRPTRAAPNLSHPTSTNETHGIGCLRRRTRRALLRRSISPRQARRGSALRPMSQSASTPGTKRSGCIPTSAIQSSDYPGHRQALDQHGEDNDRIAHHNQAAPIRAWRQRERKRDRYTSAHSSPG